MNTFVGYLIHFFSNIFLLISECVCVRAGAYVQYDYFVSICAPIQREPARIAVL